MQLEPWRAETKIQSAYCPLSFLPHNQLYSSPTFIVYVFVLTDKIKEECLGKDMMSFLVHGNPLYVSMFVFDLVMCFICI